MEQSTASPGHGVKGKGKSSFGGERGSSIIHGDCCPARGGWWEASQSHPGFGDREGCGRAKARALHEEKQVS